MSDKVMCNMCGNAEMRPIDDSYPDDQTKVVDWVCMDSECKHIEKMPSPNNMAKQETS